MVFVKFGILKEAKGNNSYILRSLNGNHIELTNKKMLLIFLLLEFLVPKTQQDLKNGWHGIFREPSVS